MTFRLNDDEHLSLTKQFLKKTTKILMAVIIITKKTKSMGKRWMKRGWMKKNGKEEKE